MKYALCLLALLVWLALPAQAVQRFVNGNTGSDSGNSCTNSASPCQTISRGISQMSGGDELIVRGGTGGSCIDYQEWNLTPPSGPSSGSPTILRVPGQGHLKGGECARIRPTSTLPSGDRNIFTLGYPLQNILIEGFKLDGGDASSDLLNHNIRRATFIIRGDDENNANITIQYNEILRSLESLVFIAGTNWTIKENEIHHGGWFTCNSFGQVDGQTGRVSNGDAHGIYLEARNSLITGNSFHDTGCWSIQNTGGSNMDNNIYENNRFQKSRCGAFTMQGTGHIVRNNMVYNTGYADQLDAPGFNQWNGPTCSGTQAQSGIEVQRNGISVINNTLYGHSVYTLGTSNGIVRNNIMCNGGGTRDAQTGGPIGATADHNLFGTCPGFTNAAAGNFHLTSANTGAATDTSRAPIDADGVTRPTPNSSQGAFEFVAQGPAVATSLSFGQQPTTVSPGSVIAPAVTVQVLDQGGTPFPGSGRTIVMTKSPATGILSGTLSRTTNAAGLATFNDLAIDTAGTYTLTAQSSGLPSQTSNSFAVQPGGTIVPGPLIVHPSNGRYFQETATGKALVLTGSHTWCSFLNYTNVEAGPDVCTISDYPGFLSFLTTRHHNFTKFWLWQELGIDILPYQRQTGFGNAQDGQPKLNLQAFNQAYFDRLQARIQAARDAGIYVAVMLFAPANYYSTWWKFDWYNPLNNTQGIGPDCTSTTLASCALFDVPGPSGVQAVQDAFVKKVIDTVNGFDNVLYEIGNELDVRSLPWQNRLVGVIRGYEGVAPNTKRHPIGMTAVGNSSDPIGDLMGSQADWISPGGNADIADSYAFNPPAATGQKVSIVDTDHIGNSQADTPDSLWKNITQGHNFIIMEDSNGPDFLTQTARDPVRFNAGQALTYLSSLPLVSMVPHGELASTGYTLAAPGAAYVVYQPGSGPFTLTLQFATYGVRWWNVTSRTETPASPITLGGSQTFTPPFSGPAVLVLDAPVPTATNDLVAWWKLEEGAGATAADSTTHGHTGTLGGAPAPVWVAGKVGNFALQFNGANYVNVPGSFTDQSYSWAMWVRGQNAPDASDQLVALANGIDQDNTWGFGWSSSTARFRQAASHRDGSGTYVTAQIPDVLSAGVWYHIAGTYDGQKLKIYLNGTFKAEQAVTSLLSPQGDFRIGNDKAGLFGFQGTLDDIRIYNYALTQPEIAALAGTGNVVSKPRVRHQIVMR